MAQDDLFVEATTLEFPALRYGPVRVAVGVVEAMLRPASTVDAKRVGEVFVTARLKDPLYQTADGERLVLTTRRNIARPKEVDGVLLQNESGKLSWLHHRLIEELESEAAKSGWPEVVRKRAEQWDGQFSFRAEQRRWKRRRRQARASPIAARRSARHRRPLEYQHTARDHRHADGDRKN
jgi:hypothetical protein